MDLIGSYGDVSDDEMEFVPNDNNDNNSDPPAEDLEESSDKEEPAAKDTSLDDSSSRDNSLTDIMPGLVSYSSHSPGRTAAAAASQNALNSLLSTYDDHDRSAMEDRDDGDIEKQYDVTVENSDDSDTDTENWIGKVDEEGRARIPPEPRGKCSSELQRKIENEIHKRKRYGVDICMKMRGNKEFRNPSIYDKLIDMFGVDEAGTNFTDPMLQKRFWKSESFYKQLAEKQQKDYDRRESERKNDPNAKIKQAVIAEHKEKRSKWDEGKDSMDKKMKAQLTLEKLNKQLKAAKSS